MRESNYKRSVGMKLPQLSMGVGGTTNKPMPISNMPHDCGMRQCGDRALQMANKENSGWVVLFTATLWLIPMTAPAHAHIADGGAC